MIRYDVSDGACELRLDRPPLHTITFSLLEGLRLAIRRANSDQRVRGIVIAGDPDHFSAGADINIFREIACGEDAVRVSRVFQEAFGEMEDSAKPIAAAVAGKVMGSALELAAACHFRVCTRSARFSMPEVNLGINPGAGGTQRLPRLIGAEAALKILLTAKPVDARRALELGLVDEVCQSEHLVERARALISSASAPRKTGRRTEKVQDAAVNRAAFEKAEESLADVREEIIAPRKILEAVRVGLEDSFSAGLLREQQAFAECMDTPATRNKIHLFFATRRTAKIPALDDIKPAKISRAAVVGMGSMGTGIVHALMIAGLPVVAYDADDSATRRGIEGIKSSLQRRVAEGKLSPARAEEMLRQVSPAGRWEDLAGAELVIEAVFEDIRVKRSAIDRLEGVCGGETIIASNTSTISLDVLAEGMRHGERLIGMHFFNPAHRMPLVEIVHREKTSPAVIAASLALARQIRKTPVLVKNREGFLVNRLFIPYLKEAFWLLEDGTAAEAIDRSMVEFGFPMGPLALIDMAGLDILVSTDRVMMRAFPRHGGLSQIAVRLVERGFLGQKSGAGVYSYKKGDYTRFRHEAAEEIVAGVRREKGRAAATSAEIADDEITRRLVLRMVAEAFYVIEESLVRRESDLDVAMVLGTGFPDFRGGVLKYARDLGLENVLGRLDQLEKRFGERFSPCNLMRKMI